jgi:nucleoside-diphosphate-sugar epimerase
MKKVLITGIDSFTGKHLSKLLASFNYEIFGTSLFKTRENVFKCDIRKKDEIKNVLLSIKPDFFIHLAGISFPAHGNNEDFYSINTIGVTNILDSFLELGTNLEKIVLASSATVYGNQGLELLDESLIPSPSNHYGASKFAMECLAKNYFDKLPIIIARPFNYTGIGQAKHFLVPKIVEHFKDKKEFIELGNIDIIREFNDIEYVCEVYKRFIESDFDSQILNVCSNRGIRLLDILQEMESLTGHKIEIKVDEKFIRKNEIKRLTGSIDKLYNLIGKVKQKTLKQTLEDMYND